MKEKLANKADLLVFYSFNGNMEHGELVEQLHELAAQGITGFFVHARAGLEIEYMQQEWFDCFQLCIDTAQELGLSVYIYDENGWPSGFCGGALSSLGETYQYKYLEFSRGIPAGDSLGRVLAAYACGEEGCSRIPVGESTASSLVAYYMQNLSTEFLRNLSVTTTRKPTECRARQVRTLWLCLRADLTTSFSVWDLPEQEERLVRS